MTVRIEKPAINVREELADLRKPSGVAGEAMLRAETPQEQQALIGVGRRNVLINGGFDVWQRGTSFVNSSNTIYYTADRWHQNTSSETITTSRETSNQTELQLFGSRYYMRNTMGNSGNYAAICQRVENVFQFDNQWVTLSFWGRGGAGSTGKPPSSFRVYANGLDGGTTDDTYLWDAQYVDLSTEWKYYTLTFKTKPLTFASYGSIPSNTCLQIFFQQDLASGEQVDWDLANVQLELGKVATPFDHPRSYGEELAACQRYYQEIEGNSAVYLAQTTDGTSRLNGMWATTMRAAPTVTIDGGFTAPSNTKSLYQAYRANGPHTFPNIKADAEL